METFFIYLFKAQLLRETETMERMGINLQFGCFRDTLNASVTGIIERISMLELCLYRNAFARRLVHYLLVNFKIPLLS